MDTIVSATELKQRLGEFLDVAAFQRVAIERHGRVIAYLVPGDQRAVRRRSARSEMPASVGREQEDRLIELCARGDFRPTRWQRAGNPELLAGLAVMLAGTDLFDRSQLLLLAERLHPGMSTVEGFRNWLERSPIKPARFLPMLRARMKSAVIARR